MPGDTTPLEINLRPWSHDDLELLRRLLGDPRMTEHLGGPESPEQLDARHQRYLKLSRESNDRIFVILAGPQRLAAGKIGYWEREWQGQQVWETGWSVLPEYQGRGIATRATQLVVQAARAQNRHRFLHAFPSVDNAASNAICHKAGFLLQAAMDFEYPKGHFMRCNDWRLDLLSSHPCN
jgi:RimJ/RimL family protein N-acetyltransferase